MRSILFRLRDDEYAMVLAASPEEADQLFLGTLGSSNRPPVADDDSYAVDEDNTLTVARIR